MKKYFVIGVLAMAVLFVMPLSAAEKVKIKLPDGLYMYDSSVQRQKDGTDRVGFEKYFVVHKNKIYGSIHAYKIFGVSKLNTLFAGSKKYKILCGGEVVGTKYNLRFEKEEGVDSEDAYFFCDESYITKNIKEGQAYGRESIYLGRLGSAAKCLAVPEEYKEIPKKVYTAIPQDEVDKIAKLAKEKLLPLVINRKELKQYKIKKTELYNEKLGLLDKISYRNDEMYIGTYWYVFKTVANSYGFDTVFNIKKDHVYVIATNYDDEISYPSMMKICGILDIDGCGEEELVIEKLYPSEDAPTIYLEIYKHQADGTWALIKKIKTS